MRNRPPIPAELERAVLIESGHRCAIPTCRQAPIELAHIVRWTKRREHTFDNIIALCPTCHTRYDHGEIDRKSMQLYKINLLRISGRYGDLEQRLLRRFAKESTNDVWLMAELEILVIYLLEDGLLEDTQQTRTVTGSVEHKHYRLTKKGRAFIAQWPKI
jgi:hypothetical protein